LLDRAQRLSLERGILLADTQLVHWRLLFAVRAGQLDSAQRVLAERSAADGPPSLGAGLAYARAALDETAREGVPLAVPAAPWLATLW
jgi:hypothetical protein